MHAALLANNAWLNEELPALQSLTVGLIDEQVRVSQIVPQGLSERDVSVFGERLTYQESRVPMLTRLHVGKLRSQIEALEVNLLHALNGRLWRAAIDLADELNIPLVLYASSSADVAEMSRVNRRLNPLRTGVVATTEPIRDAIKPMLDPQVVLELIPQGVHVPSQPPQSRNAGEALCAVICGSGLADAHYQALLEAMLMLVPKHPQMQFFFDGQSGEQHEIWKAASRLGVLSNMSLTPRRLGHRELLLRADVLVHPQPLGMSRSLTLSAMAHAIPIIAHEDHWLDYYYDNQTVWLVQDPDAQVWAELFEQMIDDSEAAARLGRRAHQWVGEHRQATTHIERILNLYKRMTGATIKFPQTTG